MVTMPIRAPIGPGPQALVMIYEISEKFIYFAARLVVPSIMSHLSRWWFSKSVRPALLFDRQTETTLQFAWQVLGDGSWQKSVQQKTGARVIVGSQELRQRVKAPGQTQTTNNAQPLPPPG